VTWSTELLAQQLAQLGRDLEDEVRKLGALDEQAVEAEGKYRKLEALHEDALAQSYISSEGKNAEERKAQARLACVATREVMEDALLEWNRLKGQLRFQQASLSALHRRVEVGRSLLSREKVLVGLGESGL
jgi:hypothetical protein